MAGALVLPAASVAVTDAVHVTPVVAGAVPVVPFQLNVVCVPRELVALPASVIGVLGSDTEAFTISVAVTAAGRVALVRQVDRQRRRRGVGFRGRWWG